MASASSSSSGSALKTVALAALGVVGIAGLLFSRSAGKKSKKGGKSCPKDGEEESKKESTPSFSAGATGKAPALRGSNTEAAWHAIYAAEHGEGAQDTDINTASTGFRLQEAVTDSVFMSSNIVGMYYFAKSPYQTVQIVESTGFGKTLVLDGKTQSAAVDEKLYHESLVHPALCMHANPRRVFIGGGGEMATAREVLRHTSVEQLVMVDLDKLVVDVSIDLLPEWSDGAHKDPRLDLRYGDAIAALKEEKGLYDVIIMDIADPIEGGPAQACYMQHFYKVIKSRLSPGGIFVTQAGGASLLTATECLTAIRNTAATVFDNAVPYKTEVPSFGCTWGYVISYDSADSSVHNHEDLARADPDVVDACIKKKLKPGRMFHYDGETHRGMFSHEKWFREMVANETRVYTPETPPSMF